MYEGPPPHKELGDMFHGLRQIGRYGLVGLLNTAIDFGLTNALVILAGASGSGALFIISLTACLIASVISFHINRSWTFGFTHRPLPRSAMIKYMGVAFLAMMVNTSVFLFTYQFLSDEFEISRLLGINLAKLTGVATASIFAFIGYRVTVFRPVTVESFRAQFRFEDKGLGFSLSAQLAILLAVSVIIRIGYLFLTTAIYGEAVQCGWIAEAISLGHWDRAVSGWTNLFCFWESLFYLVGLSPVQSAIGASLIPGLLLVLPVAWIARVFYGENAAWLAGLLMAMHPRLVAYSCNGDPETFYLLALTTAVALLARSGWNSCSKSVLLSAGVAVGIYFCVRNEGILLFVILLIGCLWFASRSKVCEIPSNSPWVTDTYTALGIVLMGFVVVTGFYALMSMTLVGDSGFFKKTAVFSQRYSEVLDPQSAAREVYGFTGRITTGKWENDTFDEQLETWIVRLPSNLLQTLKSTPGVWLTPFWFFALFLPLFARSINDTLLPEWPWLAMLFFPLIIYPLIFIEPRLLFATLPPIHLFGSAGLFVFARYLATNHHVKHVFSVVSAVVLLLCFIMVTIRGIQIEQGYAYNRPLAAWIDKNIPQSDGIVGDGYGFVATTGFLAKRQTINRLIHYNPQRIVDFVRERHAKWLILYEPFSLKVNPELLSVFDFGLPGMKLAYQTMDNHRRRVQVYHLQGGPSQVLGPQADPSVSPRIPKR